MIKEVYCDDIIYELNDDNSSYGVKEYVGTGNAAVIKEEINGLKVTEIHYCAFEDAHTISRIIVPDTIRYVEPQNLPHDLVYNIYDNGLYLGNENNPYAVFVKQKTASCYRLNLHKDNKAQFTEDYSLDLKELYIPATITNLASFGFKGYVEKVIIDPNNEVYEAIGNCIIRKEDKTLIRAFEDASIHNGVKTIGRGSFGYSHNPNVVIPDSVALIEAGAFFMANIREIKIPKSVQRVQRKAFEECRNLSNVVIEGNTTIIEKDAFDEYIIERFGIREAEETKKEKEEYARILSQDIYSWDEEKSFDSNEAISLELRAYHLESISFGSNLRKLDLYLSDPIFDTLTIPEGVKYLDLSIHRGNITRILLPNSLEYIKGISISGASVQFNRYSKGLYLGNLENPYLAFIGEDKDSNAPFRFHPNTKFIVNGVHLEAIDIPEGVAEICKFAFSDCKELRNVNIADSVKYVEGHAFSGCPNLSQVKLPRTLEILKNGVFEDSNHCQFDASAIQTVSSSAITSKLKAWVLRGKAPYVNDSCIEPSNDGYSDGLCGEPYKNVTGSVYKRNSYLKGVKDKELAEMILVAHRNGMDSHIKSFIDAIYDLYEVCNSGFDNNRDKREAFKSIVQEYTIVQSGIRVWL